MKVRKWVRGLTAEEVVTTEEEVVTTAVAGEDTEEEAGEGMVVGAAMVAAFGELQDLVEDGPTTDGHGALDIEDDTGTAIDRLLGGDGLHIMDIMCHRQVGAPPLVGVLLQVPFKSCSL